jgi:hypothetical protein
MLILMVIRTGVELELELRELNSVWDVIDLNEKREITKKGNF